MNNIEFSRIALFLNDLIAPLLIGFSLKKYTDKLLFNKFFQINQKNLDKLLLINIFILIPFITACSLWKIKLQSSLIFGEQGYAYARLTMLLGAPAYYIFGFTIAKYYFEKSKSDNKQKINIKKILLNKNQIPILGLITGIILNIHNIPRPLIVDNIIPFLVHLSAWMFLLPLGFSINIKENKHYIKDALEISFIRFLIIPVIIYFITQYLELKGVIAGTLIILSLTPASVGAVIAAKLHKLNTHLPMTVYLISSLIYLILIYPLIIIFST